MASLRAEDFHGLMTMAELAEAIWGDPGRADWLRRHFRAIEKRSGVQILEQKKPGTRGSTCMASLAAVRRHVPCVHDNVSHIGRKIAQRLDEREKTTEEKFREVKLELRAIRAVNRKLLEALRTMQSEVEVLRDDMSRTAENG